MTGPTRVACIGTGFIGGSWAALFLAHGLDVVAWDPAPGWQERLVARLDGLAPTFPSLDLPPLSRDHLHLASSLEEALDSTDFVQENAPEELAVKQALLGRIDALIGAEIIIASSTSGILPSDLQAKLVHPERLVIGHPFYPPHLMPLVEVVGGKATDRHFMDEAARFYDSIGKKAIVLDREVPGFIGNRLQAALWREAFHMVAAGEATAEQIDLCMMYGPGLRYPYDGLLAPQAGWLEAGGADDAPHRYELLSSSPWARTTGPAYSEELIARIADGWRARRVPVAERELMLLAVIRAAGQLPSSPSPKRTRQWPSRA